MALFCIKDSKDAVIDCFSGLSLAQEALKKYSEGHDCQVAEVPEVHYAIIGDCGCACGRDCYAYGVKEESIATSYEEWCKAMPDYCHLVAATTSEKLDELIDEDFQWGRSDNDESEN